MLYLLLLLVVSLRLGRPGLRHRLVDWLSHIQQGKLWTSFNFLWMLDYGNALWNPTDQFHHVSIAVHFYYLLNASLQYYCSLSFYKTQRQRQHAGQNWLERKTEGMQEETVSLIAATKDISLDATNTAFLSQLGVIFKFWTALRAFFSLNGKDVFTLPLTAVDKTFIAHCRQTLADVPCAAIASLQLSSPATLALTNVFRPPESYCFIEQYPKFYLFSPKQVITLCQMRTTIGRMSHVCTS